MIGSLSHLIRAAAIDAIITGTEKITKAGLNAVHLDQAAETHHRSRPASTAAAPSSRSPRSRSKGDRAAGDSA